MKYKVFIVGSTASNKEYVIIFPLLDSSKILLITTVLPRNRLDQKKQKTRKYFLTNHWSPLLQQLFIPLEKVYGFSTFSLWIRIGFLYGRCSWNPTFRTAFVREQSTSIIGLEKGYELFLQIGRGLRLWWLNRNYNWFETTYKQDSIDR